MKKQRTYFARLWGKYAIVSGCLGFLLAPSLVFVIPTKVKQWRLQDIRPRALQETIQRGTVVIAAVKKYASEHGGDPPPDLQSLSPRYLKSLPEAGPMAEDGWHYEVSEDAITGGWKLYVNVPQQMSDNSWFSFGDVFAYHPSEKIEKNDYGGVLKRVGRWGYYYE